jgi:peptidyl-prolyl cis-trans isomerase SurA
MITSQNKSIYPFSRCMRPLWLVTIAAILCLAVITKSAYAKPKTIDAVLAIVNDDIILMSEFKNRYQSVTAQIQAAGNRLPPASILSDQVLERLIVENIQLQMAERAGIKLSDQDLNNTVERIAKLNNLSVETFKKQIEASGTRFEDAREQIRRERLLSEVQRYQVGSKIDISETDIDLFLDSEQGKQRSAEDYQLAHILIQVSQDAGPEEIKAKEAKAISLVNSIRAGEDFKNVAISESDGQNALKGGDLGWRSERELPTLFANVVPDMEVGSVSDPIRSPSGFHIITLVEKRGGVSKIVEQTKVRHILLQATKLRSEATTEALIRTLHTKLNNGEDFATIAKQYSDDPGSAASGGKLGWVGPGEMVPIFETTMQKTPKNALSNIFKTQYGWHILKVEDRRKADVGKQLQRNEARDLLFKRRFEEELPIWLRQIRAEAFIDIKERFKP